MTPRLPLVTAALAAATLVSPASAAAPAQPGLWWGVDSFVYHGYAFADGMVVWPDLTTSWCLGGVSGSRAEITCTGAVSFSLTDCEGSTVWGVSMSLVCTDGTYLVEAAAATIANKGPFTGTVSYQQLPHAS